MALPGRRSPRREVNQPLATYGAHSQCTQDADSLNLQTRQLDDLSRLPVGSMLRGLHPMHTACLRRATGYSNDSPFEIGFSTAQGHVPA